MIRQIVFALSLLAVPAFAQEAPPAYKTNLITVALTDSRDVFYYRSKDVVKEFSSQMASVSDPFPYEGPRRFVLHDSPAAFVPPVEGQKPIPPVAFVDLPEGSNRVLLVCVPMPEKKIRLIAYDVGGRMMKNGDYRFFNFSKSNLSLILGEEKFALTPGADRIATSSSWGREVMDIPMMVGIINPDKRSVTSAYSTIWGHRPIQRNLVFLFDGVRSQKTIQVRKFYDVMLPEPAAPGAP